MNNFDTKTSSPQLRPRVSIVLVLSIVCFVTEGCVTTPRLPPHPAPVAWQTIKNTHGVTYLHNIELQSDMGNLRISSFNYEDESSLQHIIQTLGFVLLKPEMHAAPLRGQRDPDWYPNWYPYDHITVAETYEIEKTFHGEEFNARLWVDNKAKTAVIALPFPVQY